MADQVERHSATRSSRVRVFDAVRGFSVISMVLFHLCYDLRFIQGRDLSWFAPPLQDIWRCSISWAFVFIAGCMFAWSHDNLKRSMRYLAAALLIWVVTTIASVDVPINFGVIYCMGACTLCTWILSRLSFTPQGPYPAAILFVCFLLTQNLARGSLGIGSLVIQLPRALYSTPWLSWAGFPGPGFMSGDYYPLLPYLFLYLAGSSLGRMWKADGMPQWCYECKFPALEAVGRNALPIYFLHQPLILLLTQFI